jgi:ATP-dependent Lon protease
MAILLPHKSLAPKETSLPLVAIRDGVVFPHTEAVLTFGRPRSVNAVTASFKTHRRIVFVTQKDANTPIPTQKDLYPIGTLATIERTLKTNDDLNALIRGNKRVRIESLKEFDPYMKATVTEIPELIEESEETEALTKHLTREFKRAVNLGKSVEFLNFMKLMSGVDPAELADQIANTLEIKVEDKQQILETVDIKDRLKQVIAHLAHEIKVLEIERNIASKTQKKFDKSMRETVLRERMRTIQKELGDTGPEDPEIGELKQKINTAGMPPKVHVKALKELKRLADMNPNNPETGYIRTWLDTIIDMPWKKASKGTVSLTKAQKVLDRDHYGLDEVKERIIEYLAVMRLKQQQTGKDKDQKSPTILCFVGAPGVGKTSIGRSIAEALGREFIKISLGGIRDEAEIRGHRRTYVGAMPGRIIQGIKSAGTKNPVFMLDEIDKVGADFRGDPSAALLEALDPEQNHEFSDHYLEVPFDLSEVMFITTANVLDTIPPALRDRLEVIHFSGYTEDEKYQIAKRHLISKTLKSNALTKSNLEIDSRALKYIIHRYTREAGVRNLERELAKIMRKVAKTLAQGHKAQVKINLKKLQEYLGPEKFSDTLIEKEDGIGITTGLAWTQSGGDILFIEVALMPGKGKVTITGQLGDVMKESAKAAVSYVRSRWQQLKIDKNFYQNTDIHIHVPEGAVPKDGPSAGITMTTALISALTDRPARRHIGMTGEITLRGRVLEIGGIKEKLIAAHRAGLTQIILPKGNKKDLVKVPEHVLKDIKLHFVDHLDQVTKIALKRKK